jgi:hypothetical protein
MRELKTKSVIITYEEAERELIKLTHRGDWVMIQVCGFTWRPKAGWRPERGLTGYWASYDTEACRVLGAECARFWVEHARVAK